MTISATKPTDLPAWATDLGSTRVEPSAGQKQTGWTNGQAPPHNVMNWLQGVIYDWQQYLEDATDQLESSKLNRSGSQAMTGALSPDVTGVDLGATGFRWDAFLRNVDISGSITGSLSPAVTDAQDLGDITHFWRNLFLNTVNLTESLVMAGPAEVIGNLVPDIAGRDLGASAARWDAFLRTVDIVGDVSIDGDIVPDSGTCILGASADPFVEGYFTTVFSDALTLRADATGLAKNVLGRRNIPKAWGYVSTDGVGGVTLEKDCNVATVTVGAQGVTVNLDNAFTDSEYTVVITHQRAAGNNFALLSYDIVDSNTFIVSLASGFADANTLDLTALARTFGFAVFGVQS